MTPQPNWKIKEAEWWEGTSLWIKNDELAKRVFQAGQIDKNLRLVLEDTVVTGSGTCDGARTPYGKKNELEWDDAGCLVIHDQDLIKLVEASKAADTFRIVVDDLIAYEVIAGGPIGGNKVNGQCLC